MKVAGTVWLVLFMAARSAWGIDFEEPLTADRVLALVECLQEPRRTSTSAAKALVMIGEPSVDPVARLLRSDDPKLAAVAANILGRIGPSAHAAAPLLVEAIETYPYREPYVLALVKIGRPAVPSVVAALKHKDPRVRTDAARVLGKMGAEAEEALPALMASLKGLDRDSWDGVEASATTQDYRRAIAESLGKIGGAAAAPLVRILEDPQSSGLTRLWTLVALKQMGPDARPAVASLIRIVQRSNVSEAVHAVEALGAIGPEAAPAIPALIVYFKTRQNLQATSATLAKIGGPAAPPVIPLIADENPLVALWARNTITSIGSPAVEPLVDILLDGDERMRRLASEVLVAIGQPAVPGLVRALSSEKREARLWAVTAVAGIGIKARHAMPELLRAAKENDKQLRMATAQALARIGTTNRFAQQSLIEALKDDNLNVRITAAQTLGGMGPVSKDAVPAMYDAMRAADVPERLRPGYVYTIGSALTGIGDPAVPALVEGLIDPDPLLRQSSVDLLAHMAQTNLLVNNVLPQLLSHADPQVRKQAAIALHTRYPGGGVFAGVGEAAVPVLIEAFTWGDEEMKTSAIRALGKLEEVAVPALCEAVQDPNPEIRILAAQALRSIGPPAEDAIPALFAALRTDIQASAADRGRPDVWREHMRTIIAAALGNVGTAAVPALQEGLQDPDPVIRLTSAEAVERIGAGAHEAVPQLIDMLSDASLRHRAAAAAALHSIGPGAEPAVEALIAFFHVDDDTLAKSDLPAHRWGEALRSGAEALVKIADPAVPDLIAALAHPDARVRRYSAWALRQITPEPATLFEARETALAVAVQALGDDDAIVRAAAAQTLERLGAEAGSAAAALAGVLQNDSDVRVKRHAAWALVRLDPDSEALDRISEGDIPLLTAAFHEPDPLLRAGAVAVLGRRGAAAVPELHRVLRDGRLQQRQLALQAVARIGPPAEAALPEIVRSVHHADPLLRKRAALALGCVMEESWKLAKIGEPAVPALVENLRDEDPWVRERADDALERIGEVALPGLVHALKDKDAGVRTAAAGIIGRIGPAARFVLPGILAVFEEEDLRIHIGAAQALGNIGRQAGAGVPVLIEALTMPEEKLTSRNLPPQIWQSYRREMAGALARIGEPALEASLELLRDENSKVRDWGAIILAQMGPHSQKVAQALFDGARDPNPNVRNHCIWALRQFSPHDAVRAANQPVRQ